MDNTLHHVKGTRGDETTNHLLILEMKAKHLSMGYGSGQGQSNTRTFSCFWVCDCDKAIPFLIDIIDKRVA